jgi:hypothetical protein
MRSLLELGVKKGGALLVPLDEVLMLAHGEVREDPGGLDPLALVERNPRPGRARAKKKARAEARAQQE